MLTLHFSLVCGTSRDPNNCTSSIIVWETFHFVNKCFNMGAMTLIIFTTSSTETMRVLSCIEVCIHFCSIACCHKEYQVLRRLSFTEQACLLFAPEGRETAIWISSGRSFCKVRASCTKLWLHCFYGLCTENMNCQISNSLPLQPTKFNKLDQMLARQDFIAGKIS